MWIIPHEPSAPTRPGADGAGTIEGVRRFDWTVIRSSATVGLLVVVPAALISDLLFDRTDALWLALLFAIVTLLGFIAAGYAAGRQRTDIPMSHGALAAVVCYAVVQAFGTIKRLVADEEINVIAYPFIAMIALTCGMAGALFADWHLRRTRRTAEPLA